MPDFVYRVVIVGRDGRVERELVLSRELLEREVVAIDGEFVSVRKIIGHPSGPTPGSAVGKKYGEVSDA